MTALVFRTLLSHWRRRPFQIVTLLLGLTVATALWSAVQAVNAEARASYAAAASRLGGDQLDSFTVQGANSFDQSAYIALRRAGWEVSPMVEGRIRRADTTLRIIGFDPLTAPPQMGTGATLDADELGGFFGPGGVAFAEPDLIARLDGVDLPELRAVDGTPPRTLLMDIGAAQRLLDLDGQLTRLVSVPTATGPDPSDVTGLAFTRTPPEQGNDINALTDSFHLNLTAFGVLSFVVGLFIVYSAIGLAFEQRKPMLRTLRACGVPLARLLWVMLAELAALALIAGLAGVALGYFVAAALLPDVAATLDGLYGANVDGTLAFRPGWWAAGLAISMLGALIAAADTLWRTVHLPLLAPAQPNAWLGAQRRAMRWQIMAASLFIALAILGAALANSLIAGFALIAALMLGAALALPTLLSFALRVGAARARGPVSQWVWADGRLQLSRLSLALMALLVALSANIGVGTMVSSFRETFTGWLDQRLASEIYLTARDEAQADAILTYVAPRTTAQLPIFSTDLRWQGQQVELFGVADHATYRDNWPLIAQGPAPWDQLRARTGVLVNEQLALREGISPGDRLSLPTPSGLWALEVAAIYSDYGNPRGQLMVNVAGLTERFPDVDRLRYALRLPPGQAPDLIADLTERFDLGPQQIIDQQAIKSLSLSIFERTFTVTAALNVLTLGVAALALFTAMLTLQLMRLPAVAPLWAMGLTRAQLARIEMGRTVLLALLTGVLAIPVGLALAWVLMTIINVQAFGWRLPIFLYPLDWLRLVLLALVAAALAAALPALRLARTPPGALLRVFADER
ncbi:ABC transporter permease [Pontivivens insulae]|uniref:ABC3 transporter permease C-terminal domain-containing protein n=1 Tax=Pontivivens insulae TaxID=1639689 RepID=A0A2R8AE00_9RHOB|nr:ABC transporter permease [Pontivivens insulae]RED14362.1 putative ABC transport system permease protein [Pontivivens insulae]SPF30439.1 hypothetical protein POI8812_02776 [Pontivivens insulae]